MSWLDGAAILWAVVLVGLVALAMRISYRWGLQDGRLEEEEGGGGCCWTEDDLPKNPERWLRDRPSWAKETDFWVHHYLARSHRN